MLWLLALLALILAGTLALGGLIYGAINVVSMGFAAILLGLAVDYAVVHYQEALAHPDLSVPEIRSAIAPSIFWAATTTICAFLVLNFGGLPGLGQLGTLVGVGVALSAFVMIFSFLPPLFPERRRPKPHTQIETGTHVTAPTENPPHNSVPVFIITGAVILFAVDTLLTGIPRMDPTANALRPRNSKAYAGLDAIQQKLQQDQEPPLWLLVSGWDESAVARKLDAVKPILDEAVSNHTLTGFTLASTLWPRPEFQTANRPTARRFAAERDAIHSAFLTNGFTDTAFGLTEGILDTWKRAAETKGVFWPTNELDRWIFEKLVARNGTNLYALGFLYPATTNFADGLPKLQQKLEPENERNIWLSSWELLGRAVLGTVLSNLWKLLLPMIGLVLLSLWLVFRRPTEILLSLSILLLSGLVLLAVMRLAGWSWNLLNLMGAPLIMGTGVDYSIFMQLALRRYHGDLRMAHRAVGRALLLCGATAGAGFGAITFSSNAGMASLGQVCAVGIASNMLISVFLLPSWWSALVNKRNKH
jgi:predicted RND superfamily exporter protein